MALVFLKKSPERITVRAANRPERGIISPDSVKYPPDSAVIG